MNIHEVKNTVKFLIHAEYTFSKKDSTLHGRIYMNRKKKESRIMDLLKGLLISYLATGALLLLLALLLYRFSLSEEVVSIAIIAIYVIASFTAGFCTGK